MTFTKDKKMFKFSLLTFLIYFANKVGCTKTASFDLAVEYNKGTLESLPTTPKNDKIFYMLGEGMRVFCLAKYSNGTSLTVNWFEMNTNNRVTKVSSTFPISETVYDARNKTLVITPAAATTDLAGRRFACGAMEEGLYEQYSSYQTMTLAYINGFKFDGKPVIKKEDETGYLNCPVPQGAPEATIEWFVGEKKIDLSYPRFNFLTNGFTLQILNITLSDTGLYYCYASNMAGRVQSPPFNVTVLPNSSELQFVRQPSNTVIDAPDPVTMKCSFNRKIGEHGWMHTPRVGRTKYVTAIANHISISEDGDLVFAYTDRNDSGTYTCFGRDNENNIVAKASLDVNFLDRSFIQNLPTQSGATVGVTSTLTCLMPAGYPTPTLYWYKNNDRWFDTTGIKNVTLNNKGQELVFKSPTVENSGYYQCKASNVIGERQSVTTHFRVIESGERPQSFHSDSPTVVNIGNKAAIVCSMIADPMPVVTWVARRAGALIDLRELADRVVIGEGVYIEDLRYNFTITLANVTVEDHKMTFTCTASNKLGTKDAPKEELLVNHMTCQPGKLLQTKQFLIDSPANIACPLALSRYPREKRVWKYSENSTLQPIGESLMTDSLTDADIGFYNCSLTNVAGTCHYDIYLDAKENNMAVSTKKSDMLLIILITAFAFVVIAGVMLVSGRIIVLRSRKKKKINLDALDQLTRPIDLTTNGYEAGVPIQVLAQSPTSTLTPNQLYGTMSKFSQWQVARDRIKILHILGEGQFGNVYKAELKQEGTVPIIVAIKQIKDDNNPEAIVEYEKEMIMMTQLKHTNIVQLKGLCTDSPPYFILSEYMEQGNLRDFLQEVIQSKGNMLDIDQQIYICSQIASGLQYMSNKSFVHRDVAARNCLVGKDLLVKVADFGLSRSVRGRECYQKDGGVVPIRWMSPEAIQYGHYTTANDIWAFGITMWEVFSYGTIPYSAWSNEDVAENVQAGSRLIRPESCPKYVYAIMQSCWSEHPEERNSFAEMLHSFDQTVEQQMLHHPQHSQMSLQRERDREPMLDHY